MTALVIKLGKEIIHVKRFVLLILDGFGIGAMADTPKVRPQDKDANTCKHIFKCTKNLKLPNLQRLGLMNALGEETQDMKKSLNAIYGISNLKHFGADTYLGHQEIMGSDPKMPLIQPFSSCIDEVYNELKINGYDVKYIGDDLKFLLVNNSVTIADNIEADPGLIYNVTASFDLIDFDKVLEIGRIVRSVTKVSRIIAFGGKDVSLNDILNAVEVKEEKYIGINAPKSGVYREGYLVRHLGFGIDSTVQVPTILGKSGINVVLLGKVADIVENAYGKSISCVDTNKVLELTINEMRDMESGFIATNVQETDLAGHSQDTLKYAEKLQIADYYIGQIMNYIKDDDVLLVMADHGNDPTIGSSHHTREKVPILIYGNNIKNGYIGERNTLSDVGATICEFFKCCRPQNGVSFLKQIF